MMHNSFSPKDTSEYERVFRILLRMFELSRTAVVEPCNAVGLEEHRLLNRKKIKASEMPKLEALNLSGLDSTEKELLVNKLDLIEMNAEMLMRLSTVLKKTIVAKCRK